MESTQEDIERTWRGQDTERTTRRIGKVLSLDSCFAADVGGGDVDKRTNNLVLLRLQTSALHHYLS